MIQPLQGVHIVEFAGLGPAPFCGMLLAQMGAHVTRIGRAGEALPDGPLARGREHVALDLKCAEDVAHALDRIAQADALIEGFRPGVMERLGLGPDACRLRNPSLVYGRMTGWGQRGPLAHTAGHDINYIAISGALHAVGEAGGAPVVPLNLVGDFGGGGMVLAFGVVAAILRARASGKGCVVDAAMTDGAAMLMSMMYGFHAAGQWRDARGENLLDGGAPFYRTYRCRDGGWLAVGCIEPPFYAAFLKGIGAQDLLELPQRDRTHWPAIAARIEQIIATRERDAWVALFEGSDACVSPVLALSEAPHHPHNAARGAFTQTDGAWMPACAPRFAAFD
ncbi:CaiB/BaiF CoA transferase family protein [Paraburkholderia tropica]|uniref:CaiB/BaiF CoA transferase family protein n=1 Tax=Paraburkholderia tropica TaxID=92647 RepID=UPI0007ECA250|nr:CaiB/BaiF CoA-transferase family protein [Paraburkholderia tropica]MBB2979952.1 alpha-methylacyl-CoA racemase [Paraburkholderia tropica]MBB3002801.1 alpha-methylacyl-CoA racemase [Paraburkholderia tropica]MBB6321841.1 alpha-methylacyl-CoA racemase [Paraburkholderia tropica]